MRRIQGYTIRGRFTVACRNCPGATTLKYARTHDGLCKSCVSRYNGTPTRDERILDSGYTAYAREEGHYDGGDF